MLLEPDNSVHYSYATLLGTGYYTVGERKVGVLRLPFGFQLREADDAGNPGIRIKLPVTFGLHNFEVDNFPELRLDDIVTLTAMPGVELNYRINERWAVDPSVHIGYGRDLSNNESALLWGASVRSRYAFATEKPALTLGSEALYSGYDPDDGTSDSIVRLALGLDARFPTNWTLHDKNMFISAQLIGYYYPVSLSIESIRTGHLKTSSEIEFGLALGRSPAAKIFGVEFDRIGLAWRYSEETRAIILVTGFPF